MHRQSSCTPRSKNRSKEISLKQGDIFLWNQYSCDSSPFLSGCFALTDFSRPLAHSRKSRGAFMHIGYKSTGAEL